MTPEDALNALAQACSMIQANLATHQTLQEALGVLSGVVEHVRSAPELEAVTDAP